jgi:cysteine synthase A
MNSDGSIITDLNKVIAIEKCVTHIGFHWGAARFTAEDFWAIHQKVIDILILGIHSDQEWSGVIQTAMENNSNLQVIAVELVKRPSPIEQRIGVVWNTAFNHPLEKFTFVSFTEIVTIFDDEAIICGRNMAVVEDLPDDVETATLLWAAIKVGKRVENAGKQILILQARTGDCTA